MRAIEKCRTAELGGHVDDCDCCGRIRISYNSCRNRHCPKCQFLKKEKWLEERKEDLLPVPYLHVVFTVSAKLNPLALRNKRALYNILFRSVSETLFDYLERYTHRIVIGNHRILKMEDGHVFFSWRDYADGNKKKIMKLEAPEFIRRFLLHVLPEKFVKVRYYGLLANRKSDRMLSRCRRLLGCSSKPKNGPVPETWQDFLLRACGMDLLTCPYCKRGRMIKKEIILPVRCNSPPHMRAEHGSSSISFPTISLLYYQTI
jgi:hypothetical protein